MSRENVEVARRGFDAWNRGDVGGWLQHLHPEIEFRTSGLYPGTDPVYRGHDDMRRFWTSFREPWERLQIRVDETREAGDKVVVLATFEAQARDGMSLQREASWVVWLTGDLIAQMQSHASWHEALEAVGLSE